MVIYVIFVLIIPIAALIIWGVVIAFNADFSYQFGIGLALIGLFILCSALGFANWYGHNWYLDRLSISMFTIALLSAFAYCLIVLFLPDYFTYNGCTAILFALNFVFACYLVHTKDRYNSISLSVLVSNLVHQDISHLEDENKLQ